MKKIIDAIIAQSFLHAFWEVLTYDTSIGEVKKESMVKRSQFRGFARPHYSHGNFMKGIQI